MPTIHRIVPFLWFNTNAEEAVSFYTSVFKNSRILQMSRYGKTGPGKMGSVMTISFELDGQPFIALNGGPEFTFNESVSFVVHCDSQAEIDDYWDKLTRGGGMPVQCGWLKDRFGLSWQVVPSNIFDLLKNPATSDRVMQEVVKMIKLDVAKLNAAAEGRE
jgi:predicted 3-demethylubiquinone-9 3-methyltransferase (glyoxalase superfamily)